MELRTRFRILAVAVAVLLPVLAVPTALALHWIGRRKRTGD